MLQPRKVSEHRVAERDLKVRRDALASSLAELPQQSDQASGGVLRDDLRTFDVKIDSLRMPHAMSAESS